MGVAYTFLVTTAQLGVRFQFNLVRNRPMAVLPIGPTGSAQAHLYAIRGRDSYHIHYHRTAQHAIFRAISECGVKLGPNQQAP